MSAIAPVVRLKSKSAVSTGMKAHLPALVKSYPEMELVDVYHDLQNQATLVNEEQELLDWQ